MNSNIIFWCLIPYPILQTNHKLAYYLLWNSTSLKYNQNHLCFKVIFFSISFINMLSFKNFINQYFKIFTSKRKLKWKMYNLSFFFLGTLHCTPSDVEPQSLDNKLYQNKTSILSSIYIEKWKVQGMYRKDKLLWHPNPPPTLRDSKEEKEDPIFRCNK